MKVHLSSLVSAAAFEFSEDVGERLRAAAAKLADDASAHDPLIETDDLGAPLLQALFPDLDSEALAALTLGSVQINADGRSIIILAGDALVHPLLATWAQPTLEEMVSAAVMIGASFANLVPGAPFIEPLEITTTAGSSLSAMIGLSFDTGVGKALAILNYGPVPETTGVVTTRRVAGGNLVCLGIGATHPAIVAAAKARTLDAEAVIDALLTPPPPPAPTPPESRAGTVH